MTKELLLEIWNAAWQCGYDNGSSNQLAASWGEQPKHPMIPEEAWKRYVTETPEEWEDIEFWRSI